MTTDCASMMESLAKPGHVHTCSGGDTEPGEHFCPDCRIWWWGE